MKKSAPNSKTILFLVVIFLVIGLLILISNRNQNFIKNQQNGPQETQPKNYKTFKSSNLLKFTIDIPIDFSSEEKFTSVFLKNKSGEIIISKNSTNISSLNEYLDKLSNLNKITILDKNNQKINGLEAVKAKIDSQRTYFIHVDNKVYAISTSSEALFSDLDQIAQSFKYTP